MAIKPNIEPLAGSIKFWNNMIYSDPGAGKTVFAGSDLKVLFIAPENDGLMSAQTMGSKAMHIIVHQWEDLKNTLEWYEDHPEDCKQFEIFSIDSMSEMQHLAKDYVLRVTEQEKVRRQQDPTSMQLQDYRVMHELVENMVRGFNDLPVNILWTATAKLVEDADNNKFLVPDLQGKKDYGVAMKMAALMTSYGYLRVENHEVADPTEKDPKKVKEVRRRVIYWEDTGTIRGKDRTNVLKPFTVNMTLQQMRRAIKGEMVRNAEGRIVRKDVVTTAKSTPERASVRPSPQPLGEVESSQAARQDLEKEIVDKAKELDTVEA